ncbi:helix-turn-helix transcriptional regulator [Rhodococcus pyridinivorans]|uniref:Helix-turn-helix domain-containing protein n=1 Tax=Rhodococcus pyridinivorans AK37 TaxID=1114960 RepID=H0JV44_9NOCA|nr:hypothetical protein [Rhodococcus pyridinivorans]EHK82140.1 hypothetical protein AK37_17875 [Rhodococcus pyridinivorans AK37]MCD2140409.1 hypothetical protein [Rhodococcus pyridinivorans]
MTVNHAPEVERQIVDGRRALADAKKVSAYLDKPVQTLAIWRMKGVGPRFLKLENGSVRYRWEDVDAWLEAQATGGSPAHD